MSAARRIRTILAVVVLTSPSFASAQDTWRPGVAKQPTTSIQDASAPAATLVPPSQAARAQDTNRFGETASPDARRVADWIAISGDNHSLPYAIIDKIQAKVFVFDGAGRLRGATVALLGKARGDDTVPGIGSRKLSTIRPEERTTPAGRFIADLGRDFGQDILWIDYRAAISLHRVIRGDPGDHRLQRLATASPLDKRISYGCINVPEKFYNEIVLKTFTGTSGVVYILPETKPIEDVFSMSGNANGSSGNGTRQSR